MHHRKDRGFDHATPSEITPRAVYEQRRDLLKMLAAGGSGLALAAWAARDARAQVATRPGKLAALRCHASQVDLSAMVEPDAVVASARHWGAQARIGYAEAFAPTRMVLDLAPAPGAAVPGRRDVGQILELVPHA